MPTMLPRTLHLGRCFCLERCLCQGLPSIGRLWSRRFLSVDAMDQASALLGQVGATFADREKQLQKVRLDFQSSFHTV